MLSPGTTLGGRYRLDSRIASGGMGDVWKATDSVLGRTVAVKILLPSLMEDPGFAERFRGEARVVATLSHHNVVRVYDYGESPLEGGGHAAYLVMEFIEGQALSRVLQDQGRLSPTQTMVLLAQAAEALHEAHQAGIIHRDVKPGNLMVKPNGTVLLTDFGIARSAQSTNLTMAGSVLGTAAYISPEQANGLPATPLSDQYSLGVVAYQCLAGRRPWDSDNPLELAMRHARDTPPPLPDDVPANVLAVVHRAMEKDPSRRFGDAAEFAAAARAAAGDQATSPVPASPVSGGAYAATVSAPPGRGLDHDATKIGMPLPPPKASSKRVGLYAMIGAGALALVLIVGGIIFAVANGGGSDTPSAGGDGNQPTQSTSSGNNGDTAPINRDEFIGKKRKEVEDTLRGRGFTNIVTQGSGQWVSEINPSGGNIPKTQQIILTLSLKKPDGGGNPSQGTSPGKCTGLLCPKNHLSDAN
ncbi:putative serine/threonine-protein kinase PknA [Actinorhabdospora filicis]|uniref:non-specific serine/threonine protein kinase n=1 Tax=Actinorhabdospora filicis TaxID=1785913 RepID=A0A9W6SS50_9ACTN|nr:serine/threonine-protein kinase [Actinorhabdospora filicis]GLZ81267.1 putative serine/threonine-protein kinase PknA [Actinorhabdospora filicis]